MCSCKISHEESKNERQKSHIVVITSFSGNLPRYHYQMASIRVFHSLYKVGRNGNFVFKGFNNSKKKLPPVGPDLMLQIITGLGVQCLTI